jgi:hypothetical protein
VSVVLDRRAEALSMAPILLRSPLYRKLNHEGLAVCEYAILEKTPTPRERGRRHGSQIARDDDQVRRPLLKRARPTGAALLCKENREEAAWRSRAKNS